MSRWLCGVALTAALAGDGPHHHVGRTPTPDEVRAFLTDPAPDAFAKAVDRLLASPQYGERWTRHWLDVARNADSNGIRGDETRPHVWRYRD